MPSSFHGQVVLVTGAARNTGQGIAAAFAREGARVFVNGQNAESVARAIAEIGDVAGELVPLPGDIGDPSAVDQMFATLRRASERLDVLVSNAVVQGIGQPFHETSRGMLEAVVRVNLFGLFDVAREAARMMIDQGGGAIVHVGSNVSQRAIRGRSGYCASKGAVDALTQAMALDLAPFQIRVNIVAPGYIHTDRWQTLDPRIAERRRTNVPLGREASAGDVAAAVLFLASPAAAAITGARLVVDGGCSVQLMPVDADR